MEPRQIRGEIHVQLNSEVAFLQEVNDFLMSVTPGQPVHPRAGARPPPGPPGDGPERDRVGQPPPVRATGRHHLPDSRRPGRDRGPRPGAGFDRSKLPHAASAENPIAHMGVREKLGLREGGFGLLITNGMVDEMWYNEPGNEVTLIKRFQADATDWGMRRAEVGFTDERQPTDTRGGRRRARGAPVAPRPVPARLPGPHLRAGRRGSGSSR